MVAFFSAQSYLLEQIPVPVENRRMMVVVMAGVGAYSQY